MSKEQVRDMYVSSCRDQRPARTTPQDAFLHQIKSEVQPDYLDKWNPLSAGTFIDAGDAAEDGDWAEMVSGKRKRAENVLPEKIVSIVCAVVIALRSRIF